MVLIDTWIGDEKSLRPQPKPDALRDAGKRSGQRRADGAIENPDLLKATAPQLRAELEQVEPAAEF